MNNQRISILRVAAFCSAALCSVTVIADEQSSDLNIKSVKIAMATGQDTDFDKRFDAEMQKCKASPGQQIAFNLQAEPGKASTVPATPEETKVLKEMFAKSGKPFDPSGSRATYEFYLNLLRMRTIGEFKIASPNAADDLAPVRACLARLSTSAGIEPKFE
jgi:hypothetical protein